MQKSFTDDFHEIDITGEIIEIPKKKRLLIATDCFLPRWDGVARFLLEIVPRISDEYDITILAPKFTGKFSRSDFEKFDNVEIIRFPVMKMKLADFFLGKPSFTIVRLFVQQADIVWTQTIGPIGAATIFYAKKYKKQTIAYIHSIEWELVARSMGFNAALSNITYAVIRKLAMILYNRCTLLLVPSSEVAEIMSWQKIRTLKKIIHLGTDVNKFKPPVSREQAKREIGIEPEKIVVGFSSRLAREKDPMTLYRAFMRLQNKYPKLVLLMIGDGIEIYKKILSRKNNVILTGSVNRVVPYLQAMDIYVLPSLTETSSLATMEAMACGIAPICTPVGYVKDYIKEGENGMFFPLKDSYALSKKIEILVKNPSLRNKLGENARRTIVENYSWEKTVEELHDVLKSY